jgi:DNA processing protein
MLYKDQTLFPTASYDEKDRLHLLRLARTEHVGPISFFHLLNRYGSAQEALARLLEMTRRTCPKIPTLDDVKREMEAHEKKGFILASYYDSTYPPALRHFKDAPPFLSMCGRLELLHSTLFSIVGARNASQAGERIAGHIAEHLSKQHWGIVSGLARGIDGCVHRASIERGTIAVLAGGLDCIYPPEHKNLYHEIAEKGLLMSEDPLGKQPYAALFPKRNRLISGLGWGLLVVEANLKSGSLLTAHYAAEQGKSVFAIPGHPLDLRSRGTNKLIKDGACLVESVEDILAEYAPSSALSAAEPLEEAYEVIPPADEALMERVLNALTVAPTAISDLASHVSASPIVVRSLLIELELNGEIERYPGDAVVRVLPKASALSNGTS